MDGCRSPVATSSEEVRKLVLEIKAEKEENKICADCGHIGITMIFFALEEIIVTYFIQKLASVRSSGYQCLVVFSSALNVLAFTDAPETRCPSFAPSASILGTGHIWRSE